MSSDQSIRVLVATGLYPPESGGPATHTRLMEEHLPMHGYRIDVLPFRDVRHLPWGVRHGMYLIKLMLRARQADVLFAQDTVSVGIPVMVAARVARRPYLVRVPGDHAWEQGRQRYGVSDSLDTFQSKRYGWQVETIRFFVRRVVRHACRVIVPSNYMAGIVREWMVGQEEKIVVVYNGISMPVDTIKPPKIPSGKLLVSIARLVPWKGLSELLEAVRSHSDWSLVIVGDGPERAHLESQADEGGCRDRVVFTGQVSREEALGWASVADVFVLNSSYEGLSHTLLEVMSLGAPIITTDAGGNPELVRHKQDGLVIKSGENAHALEEALGEIFTHPEEARARTESAYAHVEDFAMKKTVKVLADTIRLCVS